MSDYPPITFVQMIVPPYAWGLIQQRSVPPSIVGTSTTRRVRRWLH